MSAFTFLLLLSSLLSASHFKQVKSTGVCYGKLGTNLPQDSEVVNLYKSNAIKSMRIYNPDPFIFKALRGSNIELMLDIPKDQVKSLADAGAASNWVRDNVKAYYPDVNIKYLVVGNEIHPQDSAAGSLLTALQNVYNAIVATNLQNQIKVSTAIDMSIIANSFPPTRGDFIDSAKSYMIPVVSFLAEKNLPLLANVYPYFAYKDNQATVPLSYALFQASSGGYPNLFYAEIDAIQSALEKYNGNRVKIVVSETGWPSAGGTGATTANAETYLKNVIQTVKSVGTPKRPRELIETFLFAMFDENRKTGEPTEQHFGLFSPDKTSKYRLSFN